MPQRRSSRSQRLFVALLFVLAPVFGAWWLRSHNLSQRQHGETLATNPTDTSPSGLPLLALRSGQNSRGPGPLIRVGLTPQPADKVTLAVSGRFDVRPSGSSGSESLFHAEHLTDTRVSATARGLKIGSREYPVSRVEIVSQNAPAIWIDDHQYRGKVQIHRQSGNKVLAVNVLPLEEYIASVIDSEMPAEFGREARKAQAIVARTYALYQMRSAAPDAHVDLYATVRSQKYLGAQYRSGGRSLAGESAESREIAAETRGQVCTVNGQLFCTYYCAVCGGQTLRGTDFFPDAATPLQSVPCNFCKAATLYRWQADLSRNEWLSAIQKQCAADGARVGTIRSVRTAGASVGRMPQYEIRGTAGTHRVSGADLRQTLSSQGAAVHSPRFGIEEQGETVHLRGAGAGHGVGLCQWGARGLGKSGKSALEIVRYYYPGTQIVVADY